MTIIWRLQVQFWLQASNNTEIFKTCNQLWLTESKQATLVDSIKFDKHLKKAEGHVSQDAVEITIDMKTIVWKPLMIKIIKLCLRDSNNCHSLHKSRMAKIMATKVSLIINSIPKNLLTYWSSKIPKLFK